MGQKTLRKANRKIVTIKITCKFNLLNVSLIQIEGRLSIYYGGFSLFYLIIFVLSKLFIKEVFRIARPYKATKSEKDGYRNHFYVTKYKKNFPLVLLESGINPIAEVKINGINRKPAILIRSSPHKIGSEQTPWQDIFDVDNGHIRYYGDNKTPGRDPGEARGNRILLEAFDTYNNPDKRYLSIPLIFYKSVTRNNSVKGYLEFNGYGIIKGVDLITQYDRKLDRTFSNYAFNFHVFSLSADNEEFNWQWINDRRNKKLNLEDTLKNAPIAWKEWINKGNKVLEKSRRRVSKLLTVSKTEQMPEKNSIEEKILFQIYKFYQLKKSRFEGLANAVVAKIFNEDIGKYVEGWITPATSDGGADFYGRLDLGLGFGKTKIIVLGQAKCENPNFPTGGNHVARTVARLRRGWIGVYVTTSFFSEAVQREIIEDEYPLMLINGKKLSETVIKMVNTQGYKDIKHLLNDIDDRYEQLIQIRRAEELLIE